MASDLLGREHPPSRSTWHGHLFLLTKRGPRKAGVTTGRPLVVRNPCVLLSIVNARLVQRLPSRSTPPPPPLKLELKLKLLPLPLPLQLQLPLPLRGPFRLRVQLQPRRPLHAHRRLRHLLAPTDQLLSAANRLPLNVVSQAVCP